MKIKKVFISNFKRFEEKIEIDFKENITLFVGPNNAGKTTVLQALSLWSFLLEKWKKEGGAKKHRGILVNRLENIPLSVKETNYIWNKTITKKGSNKVVPIEISVVGEDENGTWQYGFLLKHQSKETFSFSPINLAIDPPQFLVSYLPPFSGIKQEEEEYANVETLWDYIYQGLPGDVLRNILVRLQKESPENWKKFTNSIDHFFGIKILDIESHGKISVDYEIEVMLTRVMKKSLEINTLGSGSLQVILLTAFLYWNKSNLILLDEPDSHEHSFLQREVFFWIQKISSEIGAQVVISTHSEVFIDNADIDSMVSFFHPFHPTKVFSSSENIQSALKNISQNDALLISEKNFLFITEDYTDIDMLKEWASILEVQIDWKNIFTKNGGQSDKNKVFNMINHLAEVDSNFKVFWLRDGDCNDTQNLPRQLEIQKLEKLEIENYLVDKNILLRFLEKTHEGNLFLETYKADLNEYFELHGKLGTDFSKEKGSKILSEIFKKVYKNDRMPKKSFYQIAKIMKKEEIFDEIKDLLLKIRDYTV